MLPRFQDQTSTTTANPTTVNPPGLANRVGEETANGNGQVKPQPVPTTSTTSTTPSPLPYDELGYGHVVQGVQSLPEEQQPFWFVNRHQIAQHLNPVGGTSQDTINRQKPVETRSFFAG